LHCTYRLLVSFEYSMCGMTLSLHSKVLLNWILQTYRGILQFLDGFLVANEQNLVLLAALGWSLVLD
jgi:hypothetical protein